ncbi:MAG: FAD-dependent oxidoreductase [Myxococcales bacterium]|nr:MAG: FAD-dependent oxidoreductase [Myxococcales bacterium]
MAKAREAWDRIADVIVVGSGGAALSAALLAADGGADVLVLEKADQIGGTTAVSGGVVWVPCNAHMAGIGVADSREDALAYIRALSKGSEPDASLLEVFVDSAPEMIAHLEKATPLRMVPTRGFSDYYSPYDVPGAKPEGRSLEPVPFPVGAELPGWRDRLAGRITMPTLGAYTTLEEDLSGHPPDPAEIARRQSLDIRPRGAALIGALMKGLLERGVDTWTGAPARELVIRDGAVIGVRCERGSEPLRIGARRGVVLACGGFEWDRDLVRAHIGYDLYPVSPPNNVGDGLRLAMQAGAQLANMGSYWGTGAMIDPTLLRDGVPYPQFDAARGAPGTLIVNRYGHRFVNEAVPYNDFPRTFGTFDPLRVAFANPSPAWQIFDHRLKESMPILSMQPGAPAPAWVPQAPGIRELATRIGIDPDALEDSVRRFNEHAARGEDPDFRRHEIGLQRAVAPRPVDAPPFYALPIYPGTLGTNGGPRIDADARVTRPGGGVVPGLYAAGNSAANAFGWAYPSGGGTLANAMTFGYRAGRHAAAQPDREL